MAATQTYALLPADRDICKVELRLPPVSLRHDMVVMAAEHRVTSFLLSLAMLETAQRGHLMALERFGKEFDVKTICLLRFYIIYKIVFNI